MGFIFFFYKSSELPGMPMPNRYNTYTMCSFSITKLNTDLQCILEYRLIMKNIPRFYLNSIYGKTYVSTVFSS